MLHSLLRVASDKLQCCTACCILLLQTSLACGSFLEIHKHFRTRASQNMCCISLAEVGVRAWPHAVISSLGARARGGVVRLRRSVSHVVGHGHLLTSGWVPLGPVRARRGSSGTRMGPYLSRTPIRVHRVIRQGPSGPVGTYRPHRPKFGQVRKHQIWPEMGRESKVWHETKTK